MADHRSARELDGSPNRLVVGSTMKRSLENGVVLSRRSTAYGFFSKRYLCGRTQVAAPLAPVCNEYLNASVMMVESAQDRAGSDGADALNWTPERRSSYRRPSLTMTRA